MGHLPTPHITIALVMTFLSVQRDLHKPSYCRKKLVGPLRKRLEEFAPRAAQMAVLGKSSDAGAFARVTEESRALLAFHCKMCGRCELARDVTQ